MLNIVTPREAVDNTFGFQAKIGEIAGTNQPGGEETAGTRLECAPMRLDAARMRLFAAPFSDFPVPMRLETAGTRV